MQTDPYFTSAIKLERHPGGIVLRRNPDDLLEWEGWTCLPPEDQSPPPPERADAVRIFEGKWHYHIATAPWWFAKNSL